LAEFQVVRVARRQALLAINLFNLVPFEQLKLLTAGKPGRQNIQGGGRIRRFCNQRQLGGAFVCAVSRGAEIKIAKASKGDSVSLGEMSQTKRNRVFKAFETS